LIKRKKKNGSRVPALPFFFLSPKEKKKKSKKRGKIDERIGKPPPSTGLENIVHHACPPALSFREQKGRVQRRIPSKPLTLGLMYTLDFSP
jgi:hypothetical protein